MQRKTYLSGKSGWSKAQSIFARYVSSHMFMHDINGSLGPRKEKPDVYWYT